MKKSPASQLEALQHEEFLGRAALVGSMALLNFGTEQIALVLFWRGTQRRIEGKGGKL